MPTINEFSEISEITDDDFILIWDTETNTTKKIKASILKQYISVQSTPTSTLLKYVSDGDNNGAFYWLGSNQKATAWTNPHTSGKVAITMSSAYDGSHNNPQFLVDRQTNLYIATSNVLDSWYKADLISYQLKPSYYSIRARDYNANNPRNWKLQGSNDNSAWTDLDTVTNNPLSQNQWYSAAITSSNFYRYFRILQTGVTSSNDYILSIAEFELYGEIKGI